MVIAVFVKLASSSGHRLDYFVRRRTPIKRLCLKIEAMTSTTTPSQSTIVYKHQLNDKPDGVQVSNSISLHPARGSSIPLYAQSPSRPLSAIQLLPAKQMREITSKRLLIFTTTTNRTSHFVAEEVSGAFY